MAEQGQMAFLYEGRLWYFDPRSAAPEQNGAHPGYRSLDGEGEFVCFNCTPVVAGRMTQALEADLAAYKALAGEMREAVRARAVVEHIERRTDGFPHLGESWQWGECRLCLRTWQGLLEDHDEDCPACAALAHQEPPSQ